MRNKNSTQQLVKGPMKHRLNAILFSLIIHSLLVLIFYAVYKRPVPDKKNPLSLIMIQARPSNSPVETAPMEEQPTAAEDGSFTDALSPPSHKNTNAVIEPVKTTESNEAWNALLKEARNRAMILPDDYRPSAEDSLLKDRFDGWISHASKGEFRDLAGEDADRKLQKRSSGTEILKAPAGILNPLLSRLKKKPEPAFDFIPTKVQTEALAHLFHAHRATQMTLYRSLDEGNTVTAEGLDRELETLVSKGFLKKKKISPENILMILTPVGSIPIEMSKTNRLNPLYLYEAAIEKTRLMHYLQSRMSYLKDKQAAVSDTARVNRNKRHLQQLMHILAREKKD